MRILVLGADGMLGHVVWSVLGRAHEVHGTCRRRLSDSPLAAFAAGRGCTGGIVAGDVGALRCLLDRIRPQAIVNCTGLVKQRAGPGDDERLLAINARWPHQVAAAADEFDAKLVQVGTDCVFSGARGRYREDEVPDPVDVYGRSKLLGEVTRPPHLTLRTSLVGRQLEGTHGLVEWLLAHGRGTVPGYTRAVFSGLTTAAFAAALDTLLRRTPGLTGLFHVASRPISKYELLLRLCQRVAPALEVIPDGSVDCDRSLDGSAFATATGILVPSWDAMLAGLAAEVPEYERWRVPR